MIVEAVRSVKILEGLFPSVLVFFAFLTLFRISGEPYE